MGVLGKFVKQPVDVQDYDFDFNDYLTGAGDTAVSHAVTSDPGITVETSTLVARVFKVMLSGGTDGISYKVSATITTDGGRVKQADIVVKVKDY